MLLVGAQRGHAQRARGELRIAVHGPQGAALPPQPSWLATGINFAETRHSDFSVAGVDPSYRATKSAKGEVWIRPFGFSTVLQTY